MTRNLPNMMAIAEVYCGLVVKTVMKVWLEIHLFSSIGEFEPKPLEVEARQKCVTFLDNNVDLTAKLTMETRL